MPVVAQDSELGHGRPETCRHQVLFGWSSCLLLSHRFRRSKVELTNESLPEAGSADITGERKVRLETHLACVVSASERQRGHHLANVVAAAGESSTLEENLEEELRVEGERCRVEWHGIQGRVNVV